MLPDAVKNIIAALDGAGFEAFSVGGCVRDSLLGMSPSDWDITTSALPMEIKAVFAGYRLLDTGLKHGTVTLIYNDNPIEITTYRIDGLYADNRRPDTVTFTSSLQEDLKRRDFTINAMAARDENEIIDYFGGIRDLENKLIRCVGSPEERFREDALRIMRALRFAAILGFTLEKETADAVRRCYRLLGNIAPERIRQEFVRLICGLSADEVLINYREVFTFIIPELTTWTDEPDGKTWQNAAAAISAAPEDIIIRMAILFFLFTDKSGKAAAKAMTRLRFDNRSISDVCELTMCSGQELGNIRRQLGKLGKELFFKLLDIKRTLLLVGTGQETSVQIDAACNEATEIIKSGKCYTLGTLAINGNDLIKLGFPPGPEIGRILNALLELVLDGKLENDAKLLSDAVKHQIPLPTV